MNYLGLILGMAVVTMIPRLLPFMLLQNRLLPRWLRRWLDWVPAAALGALLLPGSLEATADRPEIAVISLLAAGTLVWYGASTMIAVAAAVGVAALLLLF